LKITDGRYSQFIQAYRATQSIFEREGIVSYVRTVNYAQAKSLECTK